MENVHGVDVSWLHRPQKDSSARLRATSSPAVPSKELQSLPLATNASSTQPSSTDPKAPLQIKTDSASATPSTSPSTPQSARAQDSPRDRNAQKRPSLLGRTSTDKSTSDVSGGKNGRRQSWISNISSRFSSTSGPAPGSPATPQVTRPNVNGSHAANPQPDLAKHTSPQPSPTLTRKEAEETQPYIPQRPKESGGSFFSSVARRLSAGSQTGSGGRAAEARGVCPRRIMNVNPHRARCLVPELDQSKLRRVSFSVDVEIASGPKYKDEEPPLEEGKKQKSKRVKERAEGEALKHPAAVLEEKDGEEAGKRDNEVADGHAHEGHSSDDEHAAPPADAKDPKVRTRKQEKKKKSEEERKERKEQKRRRAEENGTLPVEIKGGDEDDDIPANTPPGTILVKPPPKNHDRPTTDPVRIYRRCCQLRESPILKRITEQLMAPNCTAPGDPGTVTCLNLTGSRLQLPDFVTLGDWLAIVPVKRLLLEDADISDEGLRVVLCGLLASKKPELTRRRKSNDGNDAAHERAGIIEKLNLKNNPRITQSGWKHLALFLNMCQSIKAIDMSMNAFPETIPHTSGGKASGPVPPQTQHDAAEIFAKALAERQGGDKLEELMLSECGLKAEQIRRIVDGVTAAGTTRLGLAGNDINDEGLVHVLRYIRSGVCSALDLGHNDISGKAALLAEALMANPDSPVWGISLASCNLDPESLRILLPALVKLKNYRFLDLSHNTRLFENDATEGVHALRKYIPAFLNLKRLHLIDVGINAKQAIAIAEILPECSSLAHISLLENAELTKLVTNVDETNQEEACALYASLTAAVRVSRNIVCIDIDVPPANNNEVVKALAKQVVAYSLRNMERLPLSEAIAHTAATEISAPTLEKTGEDEVTVPDVLMHLVGHVDGFRPNHDKDEPAPDEDYIVGGTGVVKALQYCLGEKAQEYSRRSSAQVSGLNTPDNGRVDSDAGARPSGGNEFDERRRGRAKEMSKNLLDSARKIRGRLQPALAQQATAGDELAYRRLVFLDQTLEGMIQRFEDEYPECRITPATSGETSPRLPGVDFSGTVGFPTSTSPVPSGKPAPLDPSSTTAATGPDSDEDDSGNLISVSGRPSRRGSEVSLANRALAIEEGRMHRIGHGLRQDLVSGRAPSPAARRHASAAASPAPTNGSTDREAGPGIGEDSSAIAPDDDDAGALSMPSRLTSVSGPQPAASGEDEGQKESNTTLSTADEAHLAALTKRLEDLNGEQVHRLYDDTDSYEAALAKLGANIHELRVLQERDPEGWAIFVQAQEAARANRG